MLARIKFTSSNENRLTEDEFKHLENFLGESVSRSRMKIDEDGKITSLSWRETFDEEKVKRDKDYVLVIPADMYQISDDKTYIVDLDRFTSEFSNLEVTIKGVPKAVGSDYNDVLSMMNKIATKIEDAKNRFDKVVEFNQKCDVHVPGLGLLNINRLAYATDYCTEMLQKLLFQGWRIIAVCPQPDQRRPDYILGMTVSDINEDVEVSYFSGGGREGYLNEKDKSKKGVN